MRNISLAEVSSVLSYDPKTGIFYWLVGRGRVMVGDVAGGFSPDGYVLIKINYLSYRAHNLAWLFMTGVYPIDHEVDHKNLDGTDNRWKNLRKASRNQNNWNRRLFRNNTTGVKGVSFDPKRNKYVAMISFHGKAKNLGRYDLKEDAADAYKKAAKKLHGKFARQQ